MARRKLNVCDKRFGTSFLRNRDQSYLGGNAGAAAARSMPNSCVTLSADGWGLSMQSEVWFVILIVALIMAHGILRTAYRVVARTVSDTLFLALLAGAALAGGYLFS
jgi:hypothetical protein